jgi:predicted phosphodiesterase
MRIAIVSDVHGSLAALEAVISDLTRRSPDLVLHGGDLALSGPRPAEVVDRIRDQGWQGVVGNTDELLWRPEVLDAQLEKAPRLERLLRVLFEELAPATRELLGDDRIAWLTKLPAEWWGEGVRLLHASPGDLWRAPAPDAEADELESVYIARDGEVVVYGHIHRPFVREVGHAVIANSGSAGMSYDGDPSASYLLIDDGVAAVQRVAYDVEQDARDLIATRYPHAEWLGEVRRRGAFLPPPDA